MTKSKKKELERLTEEFNQLEARARFHRFKSEAFKTAKAKR